MLAAKLAKSQRSACVKLSTFNSRNFCLEASSFANASNAFRVYTLIFITQPLDGDECFYLVKGHYY